MPGPDLKLPPANWDPNSILIQKRMLVSGFGLQSIHLLYTPTESEIVLYQWKFAAGMNDDGSDKTAAQHKRRRDRVWDLESARLARRIDENVRSRDEKDAIFKVDYPHAHRMSRVGNSRGVKLILPPPPADCSWAKERSNLSKEEFDEAWRYAAGKDEDGNYKSSNAHVGKRKIIRRNHKVFVAMSKDEGARSPAEHAIVKKEKARKLVEKANKDAHNTKISSEKLEITRAFMKKHNINIVEKIQSAKDAFDKAFNLIDGNDPEYGKLIFETLGGMTLREAFWDGKSEDLAIYILSSRWMGDLGTYDAESIRFLVRNSHNSTTVLTHMDGTDFKYS